MLSIDYCDVSLLLSIIFHVLCCPFTKVEESFNMQAVHDFLEFGTDLKAFDHWLFPGVVPRTFFGAIVLSVLSFPFHALFKTLAIRKFYSQIAVRCILGVLSWLSYICFRNGIKHKFGIRASRFTLILTSLQFHICFYMSRTLPNTFALLFCLVSYGFWMKVDSHCSIY